MSHSLTPAVARLLDGPTERRSPEDFPPSVHESYTALRAAAKKAKHRNDTGLRWATPEEIALSEVLRRQTDCTAHSSRTGLACRKARVYGTTVCVRHGAQYPQVKAAAERRINEVALRLVNRQVELALQEKHLPTATKATTDLLDRFGLGAVIESKVERSKKGATTVIQCIYLGGFITRPGHGPEMRLSGNQLVIMGGGVRLPEDKLTLLASRIIEAGDEGKTIPVPAEYIDPDATPSAAMVIQSAPR